MQRKILMLALACAAAASMATSAQGAGQAMDEILAHYVKIQQTLAADSSVGVKAEAQAIAQKADALLKRNVSPDGKKPDEFKKILEEVRKGAPKFNSDDIKQARKAFGELTPPLVRYVNEFEAGKGKYHVAHCPMIKKDWVQADEKIRNPYYGKSMLACGTIVSK